MDAHVGANGPGAIGKSSLISEALLKLPIGTLSCGIDLGISGIGGSAGSALALTGGTVRKIASASQRLKDIWWLIMRASRSLKIKSCTEVSQILQSLNERQKQIIPTSYLWISPSFSKGISTL